EAELESASNDLGLGQADEWRTYPETSAFDARTRREVRQLLEGLDECGPAVGIAGIVERVDADDEVVGIERLCPGESQGEEDPVARRHVGRGNAAAVDVRQIAIERHLRARCVGRERRAAEGPQIDVELEMARDAKRARDRASRVDLPDVPLAVADRESEQLE